MTIAKKELFPERKLTVSFEIGSALMWRNLGEGREFLHLSLHTQALQCSSLGAGPLGCEGSWSVRMQRAPYKMFSPSKLSQQSHRGTSTVADPILVPTPLGSPLHLHVEASGALPSWLWTSLPETPAGDPCQRRLPETPAGDPWWRLLSFHPFTFLCLNSLQPPPRKASCRQ